jgi:hypothetical protein
MPESVRKTVTEYLQPPLRDQQQLRQEYHNYRFDEEFSKVSEELGFTMNADFDKRQAEIKKGHYQRHLERVTKTPGIHETYNYFWDDSKPFPDQGPGGAGGWGSGPITS